MFLDINIDSSSESDESISDIFDSDTYLLRGEEFNELAEQLKKFKRIEK